MIIRSGPDDAVRDPLAAASWTRRLALFGNLHSALVLVAVGLSLYFQHAIPLVIEAAAALGALVFVYYREVRAEGGRFGAANTLTLGRFFILLFAASMLRELAPAWVFMLFVSNVVLDVVDGRLARRRQEHSDFGAGFDAEVDSLFVLIAGLYFTLVAGIGPWVLVAGLLRYVYQLGTCVLVDSEYVEPPSRVAKIMAGIVFVLLPTAVLMNPPWQVATLAAATLTSLLSFSISAARLLQHRRARAPL